MLERGFGQGNKNIKLPVAKGIKAFEHNTRERTPALVLKTAQSYPSLSMADCSALAQYVSVQPVIKAMRAL